MNPFSTLYNLIVEAFRFALDWLFTYTGNYALAIMLLTVVFNMLFLPTRIKQTRNSKMMKLLQPKVDEINKKYKDDKDRVSKETMELWNKYNFNPLSGCGPQLLQMPLFFAILEVFRNIEFPGGAASAFLWIPNISSIEPDFMGLPIRFLPLLAGLASFLQSKFMNAGATPDKNTEMMLTMMPLLMIFICWGQPASLSIYWTTSQMVYAIQQGIMQHYIKVEIDPSDMV